MGNGGELIKVPMRMLLDKSEVMTYVDFLTLMKDAEAQVNDRPLLAVSEEAFDVITPSMLFLEDVFVYGRIFSLRQNVMTLRK